MPDRRTARTLESNARREARTVLIVWALALVWSVGYCYLRGYQHAPDAWVVQIGLATPRTVADFGHVAGFPVTQLHQRLDHGAVDLQLHGRAADDDGPHGQTH